MQSPLLTVTGKGLFLSRHSTLRIAKCIGSFQFLGENLQITKRFVAIM